VGLELTWQAGDGCLTTAPLGRKREAGETLATGSNPTDRGKVGTKRHLLTDGRGIPISLVISGANRMDMKKLEGLLDTSLVPYPVDDPTSPTWHLLLDRGYDYPVCRHIAQDHPSRKNRQYTGNIMGSLVLPPGVCASAGIAVSLRQQSGSAVATSIRLGVERVAARGDVPRARCPSRRRGVHR
jgi:hypothetical protein